MIIGHSHQTKSFCHCCPLNAMSMLPSGCAKREESRGTTSVWFGSQMALSHQQEGCRNYVEIHFLYIIWLTVFIRNKCWILSNAFSVLWEDRMIFFFHLLIWFMIFTGLWLFNHPCILEIKINCTYLALISGKSWPHKMFRSVPPFWKGLGKNGNDSS